MKERDLAMSYSPNQDFSKNCSRENDNICETFSKNFPAVTVEKKYRKINIEVFIILKGLLTEYNFLHMEFVVFYTAFLHPRCRHDCVRLTRLGIYHCPQV